MPGIPALTATYAHNGQAGSSTVGSSNLVPNCRNLSLSSPVVPIAPKETAECRGASGQQDIMQPIHRGPTARFVAELQTRCT
jgi:hypothetical protein